MSVIVACLLCANLQQEVVELKRQNEHLIQVIEDAVLEMIFSGHRFRISNHPDGYEARCDNMPELVIVGENYEDLVIKIYCALDPYIKKESWQKSFQKSAYSRSW